MHVHACVHVCVRVCVNYTVTPVFLFFFLQESVTDKHVAFFQGLEGGHNYCRNPDGDARPWCYVNREESFGFCPIPHCHDTSTSVPSTAVLSTTTGVIQIKNSYRIQQIEHIEQRRIMKHVL